MPARKIDQGIRSGRFKSPISNPIIKVEAGHKAPFRIYNAGDTSITVSGTGISQNVDSGGSIDVLVEATDISITQAGGNPFQGIFDLIADGSIIRSGRFQSGGTIILYQDGVYRVINTGESPITLTFTVTTTVINLMTGTTTPTSVSTELPVKKNCSVDFSVAPKSITPTLTTITTISTTVAVGGTSIQGVYDRLDIRSDVRSGRFQQLYSVTTPLTVVNLIATSEGYHRYRISNGGRLPFKIQWSANGTSGWNDVGTVQRDQSLDFEVSTTARPYIGVVREVVNPAPAGANAAITGIIDYLGQVE